MEDGRLVKKTDCRTHPEEEKKPIGSRKKQELHKAAAPLAHQRRGGTYVFIEGLFDKRMNVSLKFFLIF